MDAEKQWNIIFKMLGGWGDCQPNSLYSGKIPFTNKGKIKTFSEKEKSPTDLHQSNAKGIISGSREMQAEKNLELQERMKNTENNNKYLDFVLYPKCITEGVLKRVLGCNVNRL